MELEGERARLSSLAAPHLFSPNVHLRESFPSLLLGLPHGDADRSDVSDHAKEVALFLVPVGDQHEVADVRNAGDREGAAERAGSERRRRRGSGGRWRSGALARSGRGGENGRNGGRGRGGRGGRGGRRGKRSGRREVVLGRLARPPAGVAAAGQRLSESDGSVGAALVRGGLGGEV